MSFQWLEPRSNTPMTLSRLIKSYIDNKDPSCAVSNMLHLIDLIIMSNHLTEGHLIASALYRLVENFHTNAKGEHLDFSIIIPDTLNIFWHEHQETFPRPKRTPPGYSNPPDEKWLLKMYWDKYRECTRTGWMLDHFGLAEPDNPYAIWRETDDPNMLAMCARLLAKTTTRGTYPSDNRAREALGAALKLYAIPEVPLAELLKKGIRTRSHSQLIYRRLAVELAIRLGELQTAADIISQEMRQDASSGSYATGFLIVPGIYDVLPLLASGGKESNPCYITKDEAVVVTREIIAALESRAAHGRQWELHPSKVGWRELLDRLSEGAWKAHNKECRAMGLKGPQDILFEPATEEEIAAAEEKFGELPADLKEMVRLSNGFKGGWKFFEGGMMGIRGMTTDIENEDLAEAGSEHYHDEKGYYLNIDEIVQVAPGVQSDGYGHFIILPHVWKKAMEEAGQEVLDGEYRYWQWASWLGWEVREWDSVRDFVADCVERLEDMIERGEEED